MDSILVVDDEKEVLQLVEDFLMKEGYQGCYWFYHNLR